MVEIERGLDLLAKPRARIVGDALVLLLEHDVALRQHHLVGQHQAGHAVGLELHQRREMLARHALEIAGVVAGGEGVLLAADRWRPACEKRPAGFFVGALEHQVLEEMRDAGFARRLVGGADLVPEHVGDDRRAAVGDDHDLEAVGEREVGDVWVSVCRRARPLRARRRNRRRPSGSGGDQRLGKAVSRWSCC